MIPEKLILKNFMCYKDATLDMSSIHLACLSGDNGAGKSTILDAITWAVWGKARASDDDLISQNELEAEVDFVFSVGNVFYRVNRRRTRKSNGQTALNLYSKKDDGTWTNTGESGVRAVEKQIVGIVHTTYETFTNSAFLLQGKADSFTTKTPGERKKILAEILELGQFDEFEKQAKKLEEDAKNRCSRFNEELSLLQSYLNRRPDYEREKRQAEDQLVAGRNPLKKQQESLSILKTAQSQLQGSEKKLATARLKLDALNRALEKVQEDKQKAQQQLKIAETILAREEEIEIGFNEYQQAHRVEAEFRSKWNSFNDLNKALQQLENIISRARIQLESSLTSNERNLGILRKQVESLPGLNKEHDALQDKLNAAREAAEAMETKKNEKAILLGEVKQQEAENKRLSQELDRIEIKAKRIPKSGDRCEQCGTVLDEQAREHNINEYRKEYTEIKKQKANAKSSLDNASEKLAGVEQVIARLDKVARQFPELFKKNLELESQIKIAKEAEVQVSSLLEELDKTRELLTTQAYAMDEQKKINELKNNIATLGYDDAGHRQIVERVKEFSRFENEHNRLDSARQTVIRENEALRRYANDVNRYKSDLQLEEAEIASIAAEAAKLPEINLKVAQLDHEVKEAGEILKALERQVWEAENKLKECELYAQRAKETNLLHVKAAEEKTIFSELADAFGKKGLQAMVIDTILPEIEDEANRLLGKMTDERMHIRFDTQRQGRKGEAIETLELYISDEQGSRPYELFSGGEAFRVNFAVRVALSKLLAHRSGAKLRALFIDEGFGSQDGQGRERLVDVISSIESDFDRILVITHIQELKDVFPVRIDVVKTPTGSQISIN